MEVAFPGAIPYPLAPLVGREQEQAALSHLLMGGARLVTVTGPGGVGKSSLALHTCMELADRLGAAPAFVDISLLSEEELVVPTLASALGVVEAGHETLIQIVTRVLQTKSCLLLLDNCEHLTSLSNLVSGLLRSCPLLRVLATSQVPLHVAGERRFPLAPLKLPASDQDRAPETALTAGAVTLFLQIVQANDPDFTVNARNAQDIVAVCRMLDGLPLAIELAAARCSALSPRELRVRLERHRFRILVAGAWGSVPRHHSLQASLDWSYELLEPEEARLFCLLAVFSGGFTMSAAEAVYRLEQRETATDLVDGLTSLVNKSLLRRHTDANGNDRYEMLESVRVYGWDKLVALPDADALRRGHAHWALGLAEEAEARFFGPDEQIWLGALDAEQANLRSALDWLIQHDEAELALRMCGAMADYWYLRGEFTEGIAWLERTLVMATRPSAARAKALVGAGLLAHIQGRLADAMAWSSEGLDLARTYWDSAGIAEALAIQGNVYQHQGAFEEAMTLHREALEVFRDLGAMEWVGVELQNLSVVAAGMGLMPLATAYVDEALIASRKAQDAWAICYALRTAGDLAVRDYDVGRAIAAFDEGFRLSVQRRDLWGIADCLGGLAGVAALLEEYIQASQLLGAAEALYERIGISLPPPDRPFYGLLEKDLRQHLASGEYLQARQSGQSWSLSDMEEAVQRLCQAKPTLLVTADEGVPVQADSLPKMTKRERQILDLLTEGKSNREIAAELHISHRTIGWHISNILKKFSVSSRTSAAVHAARLQPQGRSRPQNPVK